MFKNNINRSVKLYMLVTMLQAMVFYAPVSALYRQYRGVSFFQMTIIESVSLALCILLEIPWGIVADRIGYKRTLLICNAIFFVSKVIFWQADGFGDFMVERILLSVVFAGFSGVDTAYIAGFTEEGQRQQVFGLQRAFDTAGLVIAAVLFPFILDDGYRLAALLTMLAYGAALLLTLPMQEQPTTHKKGSTMREQLVAIRRTLPAPRLLLVIAGMSAMYETNQSFLAQLLYKRAGIDERWFSLLFVGLMLVGFAAPLSHRITQLLGRWRTPAVLMGSTAGCCFLLAATNLPVPTLLALAGINLCWAWYMPWANNWKTEVTPSENRATALSVQSSLMNLMNIGIELSFGRLSDISVGLTMGAAGIFCTLGVILFVVYTKIVKER